MKTFQTVLYQSTKFHNFPQVAQWAAIDSHSEEECRQWIMHKNAAVLLKFVTLFW